MTYTIYERVSMYQMFFARGIWWMKIEPTIAQTGQQVSLFGYNAIGRDDDTQAAWFEDHEDVTNVYTNLG